MKFILSSRSLDSKVSPPRINYSTLSKPPKNLFLKHAQLLLTMDPIRSEIPDGAIYVENNVIRAVGTTTDLEKKIVGDNCKVIDASGTVVLPGFVNCHHHLYQTLTRTVGTGEGIGLFDWLQKLYPIWSKMDSTAIYTSAKIGLIEMIMSGATTVSDHLYIFPNDAKIDDEIRAAVELGVRFHPTRGSMSLGHSQGGLPPDYICENELHILEDSERVIQKYHDPNLFSMMRIGLSPCSPFSITPDLMKKTVKLALQYPHVNLHTHLCETKEEEQFCLKKYGMRPLEFVKSLGWEGNRVWFAHMVHLNEDEIDSLSKIKSGVCYCPTSNMILASGIPPITKMLQKGINIGLGLDGSASNDGNHMLGEVRQAMLLQRVQYHPNFSARKVLEMGTLGGASVLGRDDIGSIEEGKAADFVGFRVDGLNHAGGQSDVVSALVTCWPEKVWLSVVNGKILVEEGVLLSVSPSNLQALVKQHNQIAKKMLEN